jgi:hypothetical protein
MGKDKAPKDKKSGSTIGKFMHSMPGQFLMGGLTVAGIAYFSNNATNPAVAGIIGALPVGMPSSVFVDDSKVAAYSYNLMIMTVPLMIATICNWYLITKMSFTKYKSVAVSMSVFVVVSTILAFITSKK